MSITIDLSEHNAVELEAAAREARMPADRYLAKIVAHALETRHRSKVQKLEEHLDYMASQVVPGTTADEMEAALQEALVHVRQHRTWAAFVRIVLDTNILVRATRQFYLSGSHSIFS